MENIDEQKPRREEEILMNFKVYHGGRIEFNVSTKVASDAELIGVLFVAIEKIKMKYLIASLEKPPQ